MVIFSYIYKKELCNSQAFWLKNKYKSSLSISINFLVLFLLFLSTIAIMIISIYIVVQIKVNAILCFISYIFQLSLYYNIQVRDVRLIMDRNSRRSKGVG